VIAIGPSTEQVGTGSYMKEKDDLIETWDSFGHVKKEMLEKADLITPSILTGLMLNFLAGGYDARIRHLDTFLTGQSRLTYALAN